MSLAPPNGSFITSISVYFVLCGAEQCVCVRVKKKLLLVKKQVPIAFSMSIRFYNFFLNFESRFGDSTTFRGRLTQIHHHLFPYFIFPVMNTLLTSRSNFVNRNPFINVKISCQLEREHRNIVFLCFPSKINGSL